ncbi:MAG TPA: phage portal protein [Aurantimonas sp.]|nr:phage portal protein [Aurantimonas sp.]
MSLRKAIAGWLGDDAARSAVPDERKGAAVAGGTLVFSGAGEDAARRERSYAALARTGFMQNPVVYRSVRLVAEAAAAIPTVLYDGAEEVTAHPILALLRRPNGSSDGAALVEALCGHLLLSGNAYLEAAALDGRVQALHALRPDRIRIVEGRDGWPQAYEYRAGPALRRIAAETGSERPPLLLHLRLFHPLADLTGYV